MTPTPPAKSTSMKRVLLVEDGGTHVDADGSLAQRGYDVQSASDGTSGLARATRMRWDVILLT
jgi:CheY-like chemotaxis protein